MAKRSAKRRTKSTACTRTGKWKAVFLKELSMRANVRLACEIASVDRATVYKHRGSDPAFAEAWDDALEDATDRMEESARCRAVEGVRRGVWYQGERVGEETEYSDSLLSLMLRAHRPEKYRETFDVSKQTASAEKSQNS